MYLLFGKKSLCAEFVYIKLKTTGTLIKYGLPDEMTRTLKAKTKALKAIL